MSPRVTDRHLPLNKLTSLGIIDSWLRGVCGMVPYAPDTEAAVSKIQGVTGIYLDANNHVLKMNGDATVDNIEIERTTGFHSLVLGCHKRGVALTLTRLAHGDLEVTFHPEKPFSDTRVFGRQYDTCVQSLLEKTLGMRPLK